jgi:hypothetical protein
MINNNIDFKQYCSAYLPALITWILMVSLLALPEFTLTYAIFQSILLSLWSYWGHRIAHDISDSFPFNIFNPHVYIHHKKSIQLPRWLELTLEAIVNFFCFFIIIIIQEILGIHVFSTSIVLASAFLYINIHILDYSLNGNEYHGLHHSRTFCNYSPEFYDTLFNTRCNPDTPYTDLSPEILHGIFAFSAAGTLKLLLDLD